MTGKPDYTKCTMNDVIAWSHFLHPTLLQERLIDMYGVHSRYATLVEGLGYGAEARTSRVLADACYKAIGMIEAPVFTSDVFAADVCRHVVVRDVVFIEAARLLLIPAATQRDIVLRG